MNGAAAPEHLRILIAEDVDLVAEAFEALLGTEPGFEVVGRVARGDEVRAAVDRLRPDVAVLDVDLPGATGIEAAAEVRDCAVLLLTALEGPGHLQRALAAGARGYLLKTTTATRLVEAIRTVAAGGTAIDPDLAVEALRSGPSPLTEREVDVLRLVGLGRSTEDIATELHLSRGTVRNYLSNAMTRLDATSRAQAFAVAERRGWL
ncbi:response regulator transcription factor [Phycicoccus sonneratiae]|uniref:response regulator transcription factor n=1 Tax=Phycicoccus sonneratiae TaxID=2807628 RepID=UPI0027DE2231|nr:response regulator transcription factor [Phycicoccus sonneraticus]